MSSTLYVRLKKAEGCLVRLLGQIGRRGYDVLAVSATLSADRTVFEVLVECEPFIPVPPAIQQPRPIEVLPSLIRKLVEVETAELRSAAPKAAPGGSGNGSDAAPKPKASAGKPGDMHFLED